MKEQKVLSGQEDVFAAYREGEKYYLSEDYQKALPFLLKAAKLNYPPAFLKLGMCYQNGLGVAKDRQEALRYYRLAVKQGHNQTKRDLGSFDFDLGRLAYELGVYYDDWGQIKDKGEAMQYYRLAANQGHAGAQDTLGGCYEKGIGVAKDEKEAVRYYRLAADQGLAMAQCNLGWCYENGIGIAKDEKEAVRYYRLAADKGDARAQCHLGVCYAHGRGVAQDKKEAMRWYQLAGNQGYAEAQVNLKILLGKNPILARPLSSPQAAQQAVSMGEESINALRIVYPGLIARPQSPLAAQSRFFPLPQVSMRSSPLSSLPTASSANTNKDASPKKP